MTAEASRTLLIKELPGGKDRADLFYLLRTEFVDGLSRVVFCRNGHNIVLYNNESDASSALDSIKQRTALKVEFCDERTLGHQKSYKKTAAEMNPFLYINSNDTALSAKEVEKYMSNYAGSIGIEYLDSRSQTFTPQSPQASAAQFSAKILFKDATSAEFALADLTNMTNIIATNYFVVQSRDSSSSSSDRSASPSGGHRDEMKRYQPPPAKLKHKGGGEDDRRSQSPSISSRQQPTPPPPSHQNYSHQDSREGRGGGDNQHQHHYNNQDSSYNSARRGRRDDSGTRRGSRGENNNRRQQQQRSKPEDLDNLETASLNSSGSRFTATGGRDVSSKPMRTMFIAGLRNDEKATAYKFLKSLPGFEFAHIGHTNIRGVYSNIDHTQRAITAVISSKHGDAWTSNFAKKEPRKRRVEDPGEESTILWASTLYWEADDLALFLKTLFPGFNSLRFEEDHSWLYFATIDHARAALVTLNLTTNLYSVFSKDRISTPSKEGFSIAGTAAATAAKSTRQVAVKDGVIVVGVKNDAIISPNSKSPVERGHQQQKQQGQTGSPSRYAITGKKNNTGHPPTATSSANHQVSSTSSSPSPAESPSRAPPIDLFNLKPVNKGNWGDDTEDGEQLPQEYTPHTSDTNLHAHVGAAPFYPQGESYEAEKKTIEATASAEPDYQAEFYQQKGDYDENRVEYDEFDEEEDAYFDEYIPSQHQNTSPNRTIPIKPAPQEMAAPTGSPPEVARTSSLENQQEVTFFEAEVEPEEPISVVPASAYEELLVRFKRIEERFEGLAVKANSIKEAAAALGDEKIPENIRFLINDLI